MPFQPSPKRWRTKALDLRRERREAVRRMACTHPDDCVLSSTNCGRFPDGSKCVNVWRCSQWGKAHKLVKLARSDTARGALEGLANQIAPARLKPGERARRIQAWVRAHVPYVRERVETFQAPEFTIRNQIGDCDDHARVVRALLTAARIPARMVIMAKNGSPRHAVTQAVLGSSPVWLETTIDARFGEHPVDASRRLKRSTWK
jgi:transglutaminase-like putative cysteine protease